MAFFDRRQENRYLTDAGGGGNEKAVTWEEIRRRKKLREAEARVREGSRVADARKDAPSDLGAAAPGAGTPPWQGFVEGMPYRILQPGALPMQESGAQRSGLLGLNVAVPGADTKPLSGDARAVLEGALPSRAAESVMPMLARPLAEEEDDFTYDDYMRAMSKIMVPMAMDRSFSTFRTGMDALNALDKYGYEHFPQAAEARINRLTGQRADIQARYDDEAARVAQIMSDMNDDLIYGVPVDSQRNENVAADLEAQADEYARLIEERGADDAQIKAITERKVPLEDELYELRNGTNTFGIPITHTETQLVTMINNAYAEIARLNGKWDEIYRNNPNYGENGENLEFLRDACANAAETARSNENPVSYAPSWELAEDLENYQGRIKAFLEEYHELAPIDNAIQQAEDQRYYLQNAEKYGALMEELKQNDGLMSQKDYDIWRADMVFGGGNLSEKMGLVGQYTLEEASLYNALLRDGKKGDAKDFIDYMAEEAARRRNAKTEKMISNLADREVLGGVAASAIALLMKAGKAGQGIDLLGQYLQRAITGSDVPINYERGNIYDVFFDAATDTVEGNLAEYGDLNDFLSTIAGMPVNLDFADGLDWGDIYGLGMEVGGQAAAKGLTGFAGTVLGNFGDGASDAHQAGASNWNSILAGTAGAGEKAATAALLKYLPNNILVKGIGSFAKGAVDEKSKQATEEYILGDQALRYLLKDKYITQGYDDDEAERMANDELNRMLVDKGNKAFVKQLIKSAGDWIKSTVR